MQDSMTAQRGLLRTAVDAMLLRDDVFDTVLHWKSPFVRGLSLVIVVALVAAIASVAGTALAAWSSPDLDSIRDIVSEELVLMPWYEDLPASDRADVDEGLEQGLDIGFGIASMFMPSMSMALGSLLLTPLGLILSWLVTAAIVHIVARIFEGEATIAQTFGAMALAVSPQLLGVVKVVPYVQMGGITIWSIIISYLAVKHVHRLPANRTFGVLVVTGAAMFVIASVIGLGISLAVGVAVSSMFGGGS